MEVEAFAGSKTTPEHLLSKREKLIHLEKTPCMLCSVIESIFHFVRQKQKRNLLSELNGNDLRLNIDKGNRTAIMYS